MRQADAGGFAGALELGYETDAASAPLPGLGGPTQTKGGLVTVCPCCGLAVPVDRETLAVRVLAALRDHGAMTSAHLAKSVRRRRSAVDGELARLESEGLVEQMPERGRGRGWRGQAWRLIETAPGRATDAAWGESQAAGGTLPLSTIRELRAALRAARASLALAEEIARRERP